LLIRTTFTEAFAMADDVLYQGVKGVTDLMVRPGLINLDFADVRAVMDEMGKAMMGTGEATGENRAVEAAEKAIANPLLDEISLNGAKGVLINITGGYDLTLFELDEAANIIREKVDPDANIIVGSTLDTSMEGAIRVSVVATGIDVQTARSENPIQRRPMSAPLQTPAPAATAPRAPAPAPVMQQYAPPPPPPPAPVMEQPAPQDLFDAVAQDDHYEDDLLDDMPPPAYRPQATQPAMRPAPAAVNNDAGEFVAPRPRTPGTPSPEALARLKAAAAKVPMQPMQAPRPSAPAPAPRAEKPRFGIGSLINRMAGHLEQQADRTPAPVRQQPPVTSYDDEVEMNADQERIEIPAFLRRQAN
jgi:cell division protein FtsZ